MKTGKTDIFQVDSLPQIVIRASMAAIRFLVQPVANVVVEQPA